MMNFIYFRGQTQLLEGNSPTEFSSNPASTHTHTHLQFSNEPERLD